MPYYVYKITAGATPLIKTLEMQDEFASFKEAKVYATTLRTESSAGDENVIKIIFADSALEAEERLQELREAPILAEWEK